MSFTAAYASEVMDYITGRAVAQTTPKSTYLVALQADPGVTGDITTMAEDTTAGYARQQIVWTVPAAPSDTTLGVEPITNNASDIVVGPYTAAMTDAITHIGLVDVSSGTAGKLRWVWALDGSFLANVGDSLYLPAGSISYSVAG